MTAFQLTMAAFSRQAAEQLAAINPVAASEWLRMEETMQEKDEADES